MREEEGREITKRGTINLIKDYHGVGRTREGGRFGGGRLEGGWDGGWGGRGGGGLGIMISYSFILHC